LSPANEENRSNAHHDQSDNTHRDDVTIDNIDQTADDDDEITTVRWITEVILERRETIKANPSRSSYFHMKGSHFQDEFEREDRCEDHVQIIQGFGVILVLIVILNRTSLSRTREKKHLELTFMARTTVLIIINEKIAYSNGGEVTNHQIFNWLFFTGI
jgi:hypothetical protein